ncbi:DgyrCDS10844 [Dimorphilus gyrociliatus]|uniref:DgyrCDS10844 n=1 Tax=Dimorphilus gyrociliatus TaxID=2664684 RepID=A0A7I8W1K7_9ANNE|nr:DgyrCDS10844 [Dimorphilus gyrociliatus]
MTKAYESKDLESAYKIDKLLNLEKNYKFLNDGLSEMIYYSNFLKLICLFEQIDDVMKEYERVTPHAYTPTFSVMEEILKAIELNEGYHYVPKIWGDLILFNYSKRSDLIESLLNIAAKEKHEDGLQSLLVEMAESIVTKAEEDEANMRISRPMILTGGMIGHIMKIYTNANQYENASKMLEMYIAKANKISGFVSEEALLEIGGWYVSSKEIEKCFDVIKIMSDFGYQKVEKLRAQIQEKLDLTEDQKKILDDIV